MQLANVSREFQTEESSEILRSSHYIPPKNGGSERSRGWSSRSHGREWRGGAGAPGPAPYPLPAGLSCLFTPLLTPADGLLSILHDLWGKIAGEPLPRASMAPRFSLVGESSPEASSVLPHEGRDCIVFTV